MENKWTDCKREDLSSIPKMQENGFEVEFSYKDRMHNRTTPDNVPSFAVTFKKDNFYIWRMYGIMENGVHLQWQTAKLIDGHFVEHKPIATLDSFL